MNGYPSEAELGIIRLVGSLLPEEGELEASDEKLLREAIGELFNLVDRADVPRSVRKALLEVVRLARNALDQYTIDGARGFKKAFKRMLGELAELYADGGVKMLRANLGGRPQ